MFGGCGDGDQRGRCRFRNEEPIGWKRNVSKVPLDVNSSPRTSRRTLGQELAEVAGKFFVSFAFCSLLKHRTHRLES